MIFPVQTVTSLTRTLRAAASYTASPYTFQGQTFDWGGRQWVYEIEIAATASTARTVSAFLAALGGPAGVFTLADPTIRNVGAGAVTVSGGGQTGQTLLTAGWTTAPEIGDFVSLGSGSDARLHQITATAGTLPLQTLTLAPPLRSAPTDGESVEAAQPVVSLRMQEAVPVSVPAVDSYRASFTAVEAL